MTATDTNQNDAIAFLRSHDTRGPSPVDDVVQTHGALVFLHQDQALKIKRAVKYDYLDFSTLPLRRKMLIRELELNKNAAPDLYHEVIALRRKPDGTCGFDGNGPVVEWVLRMTRFPAEDELLAVADRGQIDDPLADDLGQAIAQYHLDAKPSCEDGRVLIREILEELGRVMGEMDAQLGAEAVQDFLAACETALRRANPTLHGRSKAGWVRRCHGDLHLRNIVMWRGVPTPFDALEFDERLGTCDVLYDLAFLLMDLSHQELGPAANLALNGYLLHSGTTDHYAGLAALPLFLAVRAGIRAMVDVQTAAVQNNPPVLLAEARWFLQQALVFLTPAPPVLIAIGGLSGSGKTTIARQIAPHIGVFPGAIHLRSDLERKAHFNVPAYEKLPAAAYQPQVSDTVYQIMRTKAQVSLKAGHAVILDGVHATPQERAMAARIAQKAGCDFHGFWLEADTALRMTRVTHRGPDASDADAEVAAGQDRLQTGEIGWTRLDATQTPEALSADILAQVQA